MLQQEYEASQCTVNLTVRKSDWDRMSGWEPTDQRAGCSGTRVGRLDRLGRLGRVGRAGREEAFAA